MRYIFNAFLVFMLCPILFLSACSDPYGKETLRQAESIIESAPDSAYRMLLTIDKANLSGKKEKAKYALLMSMALDKNYIDTTSFEILRPAIDYYLKNGTPDEKLKTYYYQGVIYMHRQERDSALNAFTHGLDYAPECKDSIVVARAHVAKALLHFDFYDFNGHISHFLQAANIYKKLGKSTLELDCYLNTLNSSVILENKNLGDSLMYLISKFDNLDDNKAYVVQNYKLSYAINFGSHQDILNIIEADSERLLTNNNGKLRLSYAYYRLNDVKTANKLLESVVESTLPYDTLRYMSMYISIHEGLEDYRNAYLMYCRFNQKMDTVTQKKFEQTAHNIKEKHLLELKSQQDEQERSKIIWISTVGIVLLAFIILVLILLVKSNRSQKELAMQREKLKEAENSKLEAEKVNLSLEKEQLTLENKNLQLERDKKTLEAENLAHRVDILKDESESLKNLLRQKDELPLEVRDTIKLRIEMLNSLLASHITDNNQFGEVYEKWVKKHTEDTDEFMNSNRLAFTASHPQFIKYFMEKGLDTDEINYVCLYALGLRGKEVGAYMKKRSHVNISSAIRKKLGIDRHETNIGIYVRKLLKSL